MAYLATFGGCALPLRLWQQGKVVFAKASPRNPWPGLLQAIWRFA